MPDSFKARTCIRGRVLLYELCSKHNIPHKKIGKLLVASDDKGVERLEEIYKNANDCGVKNLEFFDAEKIKELEPHVAAKKGFFSPESGIIDSHSLMNFFYNQAKQRGVTFSFFTEATGINKSNSGYDIIVRESEGESFSFHSGLVINSCGLYSDRVAEMAGMDIDRYLYRISYCRGQYFRIRNPKKFSITRLVYPPATKTDLGIHVTPDLAGSLRLGPDAKYIQEIDLLKVWVYFHNNSFHQIDFQI